MPPRRKAAALADLLSKRRILLVLDRAECLLTGGSRDPRLQLDPVDLQFVDESLGVGVVRCLTRSSALLPQARFGAAAQFGGSG